MYLHQFVKQNDPFVRFFKRVHIPDEIFFQTIILNSPLRHTVINDDLRFIKWPVEHARSPRILHRENFNELIGTSKLFARKFDASQDGEVLDLIDRALGS